MTFQNYTNNVQNIPVVNTFTDITGVIILGTGLGDLLPSTNGRVTVEMWNTDQKVIKREVIDYLSRSGDTLSGLTRSVEACVQDDTMSPRTRTQNTLDFTPGTGQIVTLAMRYTEGNDQEIKSQITGLGTSKLSVSDYISGAKLYDDSTTGTDAYVITITGVTSYAQIDGQSFRVKVDVDNTDSATLNINALGAKDITKYDGNPLLSGDIKGGQIIEVIWNNSADRFELSSVIDQSSSVTTDNFVNNYYSACENITEKDAVFIESYPSFSNATTTVNIGDINANGRQAICVYGNGVAFSTLKLALKKVASPSVSLGIRIESDNSGKASGTLVNPSATATIAAGSLTTSLADTTITLGSSITIPLGTKVWIVLFSGTYGSETINGTNYYQVGRSTTHTATRGRLTYDILSASWNNYIADGVNTTYSMTFGGNGTQSNGSLVTQTCTFTANGTNIVKSVTVAYPSGTSGLVLASAVIQDMSGNVLVTGSIASLVVTFANYKLNSGTQYRIIITGNYSAGFAPSGGSYGSFSAGTGITVNTNTFTGPGAIFMQSIVTNGATVGNYFNNELFYVSASGIIGDALAKADATYEYKSDYFGIASETMIPGENKDIILPGSVVGGFVGQTRGVDLYLTNTPGVIGVTVGTNRRYIGTFDTPTQLRLGYRIHDYSKTNLSNNTVYRAITDGIIVASNTASSTFTMIGYVATTSTIVAGDEITRTSSAGATANQVYSITFPVKKGDYWKVDSTSGISNLKFTSVGS